MSDIFENPAQEAARRMVEQREKAQGLQDVVVEPKVEEPVEPVVETKEPIVETPVEPAETAKVEEPVKTEEPKAPEVKTEEPPAVNWEAKQSEWEKERNTFSEEINKLKAELEKKPSFEFANEEIKKLDELARGGVNINSEFWKMQSLDLTKFDTSSKDDSIELVKLELKVSNPNYSDAEINHLVKRKYRALFDESFESEDQEYKDAVMDLAIDAKGAQTTLAHHKQNIQLPKVDLKAQEKAEADAKEANQRFVNDVKSEMTTYAEQPFKFGDVELKYSVNDETKNAVESAILNNATFFQDNYIKEGAVDYGSLKEDLLLLSQKDKVFKMIYDQGVSAGREKEADILENATDLEPTTTQKESWKSYDQQLQDQLRAKGLIG